MHLSSLCQILYIFIVYQLNVGLTLLNCSNGINFPSWSEDDCLETRFSIDKFMFNRQRYQNLSLRTRMNQWSFELSDGDQWTELHLFFDRRDHSSSLNNSIPNGHIINKCDSFISRISNNSDSFVPELLVMDKRIESYFINDGIFRTINYIHCKIDERRRNPPIHIQIDIYFVTNREFQSLICIEMSNTTQELFSGYQAKFYLHNHQTNFKYNFNVSNINYALNSSTSVFHMIKLYKQTQVSSNSLIISFNIMIILFNFFFFLHCFLFIR
jgi:hypothetical protein